MQKLKKMTYFSFVLFLLGGCIHRASRPEPKLAPHVDVPRFMGTWYVIAAIPLAPEKEAFNETESYQLDKRGRILTKNIFNKGDFSGPLKTYSPVGTVYNTTTNAEWRMQFVWPFKFSYLIHYVEPDYSATVVGEPGLKHVWIMARTPHIADDKYRDLVSRASSIGYDTSHLRLVPHNKTQAS